LPILLNVHQDREHVRLVYDKVLAIILENITKDDEKSEKEELSNLIGQLSRLMEKINSKKD
jgi:hypothetical protein